MTVTHARSADLNLLTALAVLLEERNVSRAAEQFHLSQSAMSRTLQRLRDTFGDELLVRTGSGYELTPRARKIQRELALILPRLDALLRGDDYDPVTATDVFALSGTDFATAVLGPVVLERLFKIAPLTTVNFMPWHDGTHEDLELGRLDLLFTGHEPGGSLHSEILFHEGFVCVVSEDHPVREPLDLGTYLDHQHVLVNVGGGQQTKVEEPLRALGVRRTTPLHVPYFAAAIQAAARSRLIATVPERILPLYEHQPGIRVVAAPPEIKPFPYYMAWHPRLDTDIANRWLRDLIRSTVAD
jgi:DNA-binding transcriptional LysR family regulator